MNSLIMSSVFFQYYQSSNESKIQHDYKKLGDYEIRQFAKQASNCVVTSLNFAMSERMPHQPRKIWANLSQCQLMKVAMEQLLQVQMLRIRAKEHVQHFEAAL